MWGYKQFSYQHLYNYVVHLSDPNPIIVITGSEKTINGAADDNDNEDECN